MTDRVYPSAKPNGTAATGTAAVATTVPIAAPPSTKAHLYNNNNTNHHPTRHPYRPTPTTSLRHKHDRRFSCRRCLRVTCFWSFLLLIAILLLAAIAAAAAYLLYQPRRPLFSVTSVRISNFNLTTAPSDESTRLASRINVTLSAKNPNKRITFLYDRMTVTVRSRSIDLSNGSFASFASSPYNISIIHPAMAMMNNQVLDADSLNTLKSDLKSKRGLPLEIVMDTMVGVKLEKRKLKKIGIRIKCGGVHGKVPKGKTVIPANTANAKCKVDLRIKIWKLTF